MEGARWSQEGTRHHHDDDQLSAEEKGGSLEKGGRLKAKKNLGLDFMLRKVESDEKQVMKGDDGSARLAFTEPEKEALEMDGRVLLPSGSGQEVARMDESRTHAEEMMKETKDGNDMLAEVVRDSGEVVSDSASRLPVDKKVQGIKKNLSLGFMLRKPLTGDALEKTIYEQGLDSRPGLGETAAEDILADRVSNSSLKLSADRKVQGAKKNLGLGFVLKKPSKGETDIVEMASGHGFDSIPKLGETIEDFTLIPSQSESTTEGNQMSIVGPTKEQSLHGELEMIGGGDIEIGNNFADLSNQQDNKKLKHSLKRLLSISKVKNGNSEKRESGEKQQVRIL